MKEIWFIRHGESESNAGFITPEPENIALTEKGIEQSKLILSALTETPDLIVTSPFLRTKQTAEPVISKFPNAKVEEWNVQEFNYLSLTKYENTTLESRRPYIEEYWKRARADFRDGDESESFADFIFRVKNLLEKLSVIQQEKIVIFTHRQFVASTLWLLINEFPEINDALMKRYYNFLNSIYVPNASIFKLFIEESSKDFRSGGISTKHLPKKLITL